MAKKNDELLQRLLATFRVEADDHLQAMSSGLLALEKMPGGEQHAEIVEKIFREAHSLKGAARAVNLTEIESACQSLESVFAGLKSGQREVSRALFDLVYRSIDTLAGLLAPEAGATGAREPAVTEPKRQREGERKGPVPDSEAPGEIVPTADARTALPAPGPTTETIRISTSKLDSVMRQVEELLTLRLASGERAGELREAAALLATRKKERAKIQPAVRRVEQALERAGKSDGAGRGRPETARLIEYLGSENFFLKTLENRLAGLGRSAAHDLRTLAGMTEGLLRDVKEMHMLPFSSLLEIFPRFTRELARDRGKEVDLSILGGEIEIDRRILEEMKDPLIHMFRNSIDHGIEQPAAREAKRKPPRGTITVAVSQKDSGKVEILIADDGAGIDPARVKAAAAKLGVVPADEADRLGEEDALALIFQSGITTSPIITDVSGRGLGLAIVREKVERLGGSVALEARPGEGTSFRITLPLTLATFRGVLVRTGEHLFVIPTNVVERVARVPATDIRTVENRETISFDGRPISLVRLGDVMQIPRKGVSAEAQDHAQVLVLSRGVARIAFRVDEILGEQEVLVKALGSQLARVRNIAGASVLGTGRVVPVLNAQDLTASAVKQAVAPPAAAAEPVETKERSVLVVEDSITSRALLKGILESAGYRVATAVDGIDAYTALKTGEFDLVVSDVEMPRMDGFDLTARVRADKQLAEMPVVLVTALESREHRERGIDVGANAYIVKSSFDQSNLLEVVRRLI